MPTPGSSAVVTDVNGVPAAQAWDNATSAYFYIYGESTKAESFSRQAPIVPSLIGAYAVGKVVKTGAGTFFGAYGQYKGASAAWIMIFDASSAPATATVPLAAAAIGPTAAGVDNNWFIAPGKPYTFTTGLYIAISTTGGTFTASASTDLTGTIEYI